MRGHVIGLLATFATSAVAGDACGPTVVFTYDEARCEATNCEAKLEMELSVEECPRSRGYIKVRVDKDSQYEAYQVSTHKWGFETSHPSTIQSGVSLQRGEKVGETSVVEFDCTCAN